MTWDEALGDLFFGQRYFSYFTTFDRRYLDFRGDPYPADFRPDLSSSPFRFRPWEHYPVASTLATATSHLFTSLKLLDPFDGYHAFNVILAALFLIVFYRFVEDGDGVVAAITAALLLFAAPRIAADTLGNVKDYAEMVFFATALVGAAMPNLKAVLALGLVAHAAALKACGIPPTRIRFRHGALHELPDGLLLADSYHVSRQNTSTGRLTPAMFEQVVRDLLLRLETAA